MIASLKKSDSFGAFISGLCLIHCLVTPFLFVLSASASYIPSWWKGLDYIFLALAFLAVYRSTQITSKQIIKPLMWGSWSLLAFVLMNEKLAWIELPEVTIFIPTMSLIGLHIYNRKYCLCKEEKCCTS